MFKLYNQIISFGIVGYWMEQEFLSKAVDAFFFVECWNVLMYVFLGMILTRSSGRLLVLDMAYFSMSMVSRSLVQVGFTSKGTS